MENFDCIFGFSVKTYVRNTINLSCAKILLTSVIFQMWIWLAVGIGKFWFLDTQKLHGL